MEQKSGWRTYLKEKREYKERIESVCVNLVYEVQTDDENERRCNRGDFSCFIRDLVYHLHIQKIKKHRS